MSLARAARAGTTKGSSGAGSSPTAQAGAIRASSPGADPALGRSPCSEAGGAAAAASRGREGSGSPRQPGAGPGSSAIFGSSSTTLGSGWSTAPTADVLAPPWLSAAATRRTAEAVARLLGDPAIGVRSPVAASYDALTRETVASFGDAVARCAGAELQEPWLSAFHSALPPEPGPKGPSASPAAEGWGRFSGSTPSSSSPVGPGLAPGGCGRSAVPSRRRSRRTSSIGTGCSHLGSIRAWSSCTRTSPSRRPRQWD